MDTLELHDELTVAVRAIRRLAGDLTADLRRATGQPEDYVEFTIGRPDGVYQSGAITAFAHRRGGDVIAFGNTVADATDKLRAEIAKLPDPKALARARFAEARAALVAAGVDPAEAA